MAGCCARWSCAVQTARLPWPLISRSGLTPTEMASAVQAYEARYGGLADQPIGEWEAGFPHDEIERAEFEAIWHRARAHLAGVGKA